MNNPERVAALEALLVRIQKNAAFPPSSWRALSASTQPQEQAWAAPALDARPATPAAPPVAPVTPAPAPVEPIAAPAAKATAPAGVRAPVLQGAGVKGFGGAQRPVLGKGMESPKPAAVAARPVVPARAVVPQEKKPTPAPIVGSPVVNVEGSSDPFSAAMDFATSVDTDVGAAAEAEARVHAARAAEALAAQEAHAAEARAAENRAAEEARAAENLAAQAAMAASASLDLPVVEAATAAEASAFHEPTPAPRAAEDVERLLADIPAPRAASPAPSPVIEEAPPLPAPAPLPDIGVDLAGEAERAEREKAITAEAPLPSFSSGTAPEAPSKFVVDAAPAPPRRSRVPMLLILAFIVLVAAVLAFFYMSSRDPKVVVPTGEPAATATAKPTVAPTATATSTTTAPVDTSSAAAPPTGSADTTAAPDPAAPPSDPKSLAAGKAFLIVKAPEGETFTFGGTKTGDVNAWTEVQCGTKDVRVAKGGLGVGKVKRTAIKCREATTIEFSAEDLKAPAAPLQMPPPALPPPPPPGGGPPPPPPPPPPATAQPTDL